MKKCVVQLLQGKTRILCTHRLEFVEQADTVVLMEEGTIVRTGRKDLVHRNRHVLRGKRDFHCWLEGEFICQKVDKNKTVILLCRE